LSGGFSANRSSTPSRIWAYDPDKPPPAPRQLRKPPLLTALATGCCDKVAAALAEDPEAARLPFVDHGWEPPLCCAARLCCPTQIFSLLLEKEADVEQQDTHGRSPLDVLIQTLEEKTPSKIDLLGLPSGFTHEARVKMEADIARRRAEVLATAGLLFAAGAELGRGTQRLACDGSPVHQGLATGQRLARLFLVEE